MEAQRRYRKSKGASVEARGPRFAAPAVFRLLDPGLWTNAPQTCWDLELERSEEQGQEFRLESPDEPTARATFEHAHPNLVTERRRMVADLTRPAELNLDEPDHPDAPDPDEDSNDE